MYKADTLIRTNDGKWYRVDVEIDMAKLLEQLGHKALHNRSKRTRAYNGLIKARVTLAKTPGDWKP